MSPQLLTILLQSTTPWDSNFMLATYTAHSLRTIMVKDTTKLMIKACLETTKNLDFTFFQLLPGCDLCFCSMGLQTKLPLVSSILISPQQIPMSI